MKTSSRWILSCCFLLMLSNVVFGFDQSNSDSMSIPYFPLHKGDLFQYYSWRYMDGMGLSSSTQITYYDVDTLIEGKRYIGSLSDHLYRTNCKDSIWYYGGKTGDVELARWGFEFLGLPILTVAQGDSVWERYGNNNFFGFSYADKFGLVDVQNDDGDGDYKLVGCRINGIEYGTMTAVDNTAKEAPLPFSLDLRNFPNPFSASTTIAFTLAHVGLVDLALYDVVGRRVAGLAHTVMEAGQHVLDVQTGLVPGVYSCVLRCGNVVVSRMVTVVQ